MLWFLCEKKADKVHGKEEDKWEAIWRWGMRKWRVHRWYACGVNASPKPNDWIQLARWQGNANGHITSQTGYWTPFFYYENVALAPKGVWVTISSFLYDIQPEFVDSKFFCAAARKRGYIHNLPTNNSFPVIPVPPKTIHGAFPDTNQWWPSWDRRRHFNCIQTCRASSALTERIHDALANSEDPPCPAL